MCLPGIPNIRFIQCCPVDWVSEGARWDFKTWLKGWSVHFALSLVLGCCGLGSAHAQENKIVAGFSHTCVIGSNNGVKCWGANSYGQLGDGSITGRLTPVAVTGLTNGVIALAAGGYHTCARIDGGAVKCWGDNGSGQIGDNSKTGRLTPVAVTGLSSGVIALAAGTYHTCALTSGGGVLCWGDNIWGQLGDGSTTDRLIPVAVTGLSSGVVAIGAGRYHTCALTNGGGVKCWGANIAGQLGDGSTTDRLTPVSVSGLTSGGIALATGGYHSCALTVSGGMQGVQCWGSNQEGELGDNSTIRRSAPVNVSGLASGVTALVTGEYHSCALLFDGTAKCWGYNANGELGDGSVAIRLTPVTVNGQIDGAITFALGEYHTCALFSRGSVKCWGNNSAGQLGDGSTTNRLIPVDLVGETQRANQTVSFALAPTIVVGAKGAVVATATSGLAVSFTSTTPSVCTVSGSTVSGLSAGTCIIAANQGGNANYNAAAEATQSILVAQAVPVVSLSATSLIFAAQRIGTASASQTISLTNTSTQALNVNGIAANGDFVETNDCGAHVAAGASCTLTIFFTPTFGAGSISGSVIITSNAPAGASIINLLGIAIEAPAFTLNFSAGWNLVGNSFSDLPLNLASFVASLGGDSGRITSVWKWIRTGSTTAITYPTWGFFAPLQADEGRAYAVSKGYEFLTSINGGEGFWVNASSAFSAQIPIGSPVTASSLQSSLLEGWNLVAAGDQLSPSQFNFASMQEALAGPTRIISLWAWNNSLKGWYFYSPSLESKGGTTLADYNANKGYLDFGARTLDRGMGFWVNISPKKEHLDVYATPPTGSGAIDSVLATYYSPDGYHTVFWGSKGADGGATGISQALTWLTDPAEGMLTQYDSRQRPVIIRTLSTGYATRLFWDTDKITALFYDDKGQYLAGSALTYDGSSYAAKPLVDTPHTVPLLNGTMVVTTQMPGFNGNFATSAATAISLSTLVPDGYPRLKKAAAFADLLDTDRDYVLNAAKQLAFYGAAYKAADWVEKIASGARNKLLGVGWLGDPFGSAIDYDASKLLDAAISVASKVVNVGRSLVQRFQNGEDVETGDTISPVIAAPVNIDYNAQSWPQLQTPVQVVATITSDVQPANTTTLTGLGTIDESNKLRDKVEIYKDGPYLMIATTWVSPNERWSMTSLTCGNCPIAGGTVTGATGGSTDLLTAAIPIPTKSQTFDWAQVPAAAFRIALDNTVRDLGADGKSVCPDVYLSDTLYYSPHSYATPSYPGIQWFWLGGKYLQVEYDGTFKGEIHQSSPNYGYDSHSNFVILGQNTIDRSIIGKVVVAANGAGIYHFIGGSGTYLVKNVFGSGSGSNNITHCEGTWHFVRECALSNSCSD